MNCDWITIELLLNYYWILIELSSDYNWIITTSSFHRLSISFKSMAFGYNIGITDHRLNRVLSVQKQRTSLWETNWLFFWFCTFNTFLIFMTVTWPPKLAAVHLFGLIYGSTDTVNITFILNSVCCSSLSDFGTESIRCSCFSLPFASSSSPCIISWIVDCIFKMNSLHLICICVLLNTAAFSPIAIDLV